MYWPTGILGLALGGAPFVLGYSDNAAAMWTSIALGAVVVVLSAIEAVDTSGQTWEYWGGWFARSHRALRIWLQHSYLGVVGDSWVRFPHSAYLWI